MITGYTQHFDNIIVGFTKKINKATHDRKQRQLEKSNISLSGVLNYVMLESAKILSFVTQKGKHKPY